jgi:hypothetical protein
LDVEGSAPEPQGTNSEPKPKRSRGPRKPNQYPGKDKVYVITEVGPEGDIIEKSARAKFRNAMGALIRDELNPAVPSWHQVLDEKKKTLRDKIKENFCYPSKDLEKCKHNALKIMRQPYRRKKSQHNTK